MSDTKMASVVSLAAFKSFVTGFKGVLCLRALCGTCVQGGRLRVRSALVRDIVMFQDSIPLRLSWLASVSSIRFQYLH